MPSHAATVKQFIDEFCTWATAALSTLVPTYKPLSLPFSPLSHYPPDSPEGAPNASHPLAIGLPGGPCLHLRARLHHSDGIVLLHDTLDILSRAKCGLDGLAHLWWTQTVCMDKMSQRRRARCAQQINVEVGPSFSASLYGYGRTRTSRGGNMRSKRVRKLCFSSHSPCRCASSAPGGSQHPARTCRSCSPHAGSPWCPWSGSRTSPHLQKMCI